MDQSTKRKLSEDASRLPIIWFSAVLFVVLLAMALTVSFSETLNSSSLHEANNDGGMQSTITVNSSPVL